MNESGGGKPQINTSNLGITGNKIHKTPSENNKHIHQNRTNKFKGGTSSMNGHAFQTVTETSDLTHFINMLEVLEHHCTTQYNNDFSSIFKYPPDNSLLTIPITKKADKTFKNYAFQDAIYLHQLKQ